MSVRKETIGACELYLLDGREFFWPWPRPRFLGPAAFGKIDAVVSDPPYGIRFVHGGGGRGFGRVGGRDTLDHNAAPIVGDDKPFDPAPWLGCPELILWGADHYAARLPHGRWLAWDKLAGNEPWDTFSDVEFAWHSKPGAARIFSLLWKGALKGAEKTGGKQRERWHPTQKPVALMEWCIGELRGPAETILDPFMGSGTTGVACVKLGRRFIGFEIVPEYFDVACRRVEAATKQPDLFIEQAPLAQQLNLLEAAG